MALRGETIHSGAAAACEDCGRVLVPQVCRSGGGFYIGTWCDCGPYSRESGYFRSREEAEAILQADPSEYARGAGPAGEPLDLERVRRHLEVLADALAAPGIAVEERPASH